MDLQAYLLRGKEKLLSLGVKQWGMLLLAGICCIVIVFPMGGEKKDTDKAKSIGLQDTGNGLAEEEKSEVN